jgi:hypothetical protein
MPRKWVTTTTKQESLGFWKQTSKNDEVNNIYKCDICLQSTGVEDMGLLG